LKIHREPSFRGPIASSSPSSRPNPTAWALGSRSADRSSRSMARRSWASPNTPHGAVFQFTLSADRSEPPAPRAALGCLAHPTGSLRGCSATKVQERWRYLHEFHDQRGIRATACSRNECPLLGVNQTYLGFRLKSEFDSKRDIGGGSQVTVALPITRADGIGAETASSTKREFSSDRAAV
jgi:hypothetical protein